MTKMDSHVRSIVEKLLMNNAEGGNFDIDTLKITSLMGGFQKELHFMFLMSVIFQETENTPRHKTALTNLEQCCTEINSQFKIINEAEIAPIFSNIGLGYTSVESERMDSVITEYFRNSTPLNGKEYDGMKSFQNTVASHPLFKELVYKTIVMHLWLARKCVSESEGRNAFVRFIRGRGFYTVYRITLAGLGIWAGSLLVTHFGGFIGSSSRLANWFYQVDVAALLKAKVLGSWQYLSAYASQLYRQCPLFRYYDGTLSAGAAYVTAKIGQYVFIPNLNFEVDHWLTDFMVLRPNTTMQQVKNAFLTVVKQLVNAFNFVQTTELVVSYFEPSWFPTLMASDLGFPLSATAFWGINNDSFKKSLEKREETLNSIFNLTGDDEMDFSEQQIGIESVEIYYSSKPSDIRPERGTLRGSIFDHVVDISQSTTDKNMQQFLAKFIDRAVRKYLLNLFQVVKPNSGAQLNLPVERVVPKLIEQLSVNNSNKTDFIRSRNNDLISISEGSKRYVLGNSPILKEVVSKLSGDSDSLRTMFEATIKTQLESVQKYKAFKEFTNESLLEMDIAPIDLCKTTKKITDDLLNCNRIILIDLKESVFDKSVEMFNERREFSELESKVQSCTSIYLMNHCLMGTVLIGIKDSYKEEKSDKLSNVGASTLSWPYSDSVITFMDDVLNRIVTLQSSSTGVLKNYKNKVCRTTEEIQRICAVVEAYKNSTLYEQLLLLLSSVVCRLGKLVTTVGLRWIENLGVKTLAKAIDQINTCSFVLNVLYSKAMRVKNISKGESHQIRYLIAMVLKTVKIYCTYVRDEESTNYYSEKNQFSLDNLLQLPRKVSDVKNVELKSLMRSYLLRGVDIESYFVLDRLMTLQNSLDLFLQDSTFVPNKTFVKLLHDGIFSRKLGDDINSILGNTLEKKDETNVIAHNYPLKYEYLLL